MRWEVTYNVNAKKVKGKVMKREPGRGKLRLSINIWVRPSIHYVLVSSSISITASIKQLQSTHTTQLPLYSTPPTFKMYTSTIALAIAPLLYLAHADVSLDRDDVPRACDTICDPIVQLTQKCDSDRWGDAQEIQCVCTNDSFNVERIAALCANCIHQNASQDRDDDDDDDNDIRDETESKLTSTLSLDCSDIL